MNAIKSDVNFAIEGLMHPTFLPMNAAIRVDDEKGDAAAAVVSVPGMPTQLSDLSEISSHTYDLTITRAGELNIPVFGGGSANMNQRVVVYEWKKFKIIRTNEGIENHYGLVIRFAVTVDKWEANANIGLPFLSAKAQLGQVKASWQMQVRGIAGPEIDKHILPPGDLNVKTFVVGTQSLEKIIGAIEHDTTTFVPVLIETIDPGSLDNEHWLSAVAAFSVYSIRKGRKESNALARLNSTDQAANDELREIYKSFGITGSNSPDEEARRRAAAILRNLSVDT